jgi:hypothetical protein
MKDITINHYRNEDLLWSSSIRNALISRDLTDTVLEDVSIHYPERKLRLTAEAGTDDLGTGEINLAGRVTGIGEDISFESPDLTYIPSEKTLTASEKLVIKGKGYLITGNSGKIIDSQRLEVDGNVRAVFY